MASTAEAVRDKDEAPAIPPMLARPEEAKAPTEDAPLASFSDIAKSTLREAKEIAPSRAEMDKAQENVVQTRERAQRNAEDFAKSQDAAYDKTMKEAERLAAEAQARQAPIQATEHALQQQLAAQPTRGLRPFLASSPNEPPEASITKLITGLSTFAQMIGGGRAGARGALSAMTGALEGWQAGDKARADRAFSDWKARTEALLDAWAMELRSYESWFKAGGMPLEQMKLGLELEARRFGNHKLGDDIAMGTTEQALKHIDDRHKFAVGLKSDVGKMIATKEAGDARYANAIALAELKAQQAKDLAEFKSKIQEDQVKSALAEITGGGGGMALKKLGQDYALSGKMPSIGYGGKVGQAVKFKIVKAGVDWAQENGIDPMGLPSLQSEIKSAQKEADKIAQTRAFTIVNFGTFELHMDQLVELGKKVPRSEIPAVNEAIVKGQRDYGGSKEAAAFVALGYEVGMEYAKVLVGTAQGDANSRDEGRKAISFGLINEQLAYQGETLKQAGRNRIQSLDAARADALSIYERVGAGKGSLAGGKAAARSDVEAAMKESGGDGTKARALLIQRGFDPAKELAKDPEKEAAK